MIEDSCDAIGPKLRGTPTGTRSDITVTSFSLSHIITAAGQGGMVMLDDEALRDRCLTLRGWGRRSEPVIYGSKRKDRNFWEDLDGIRYDNLFIFDEPGWNFLPSEMSAAFGVQQVKKLPHNYARRQRTFTRYTDFFNRYPDVLHPTPPDGGARHGMADVLLPGAPPSRVRALRSSGLLGATRHRYPHGVDRQRRPPTLYEKRPLPCSRGRAAQRRPCHGIRHARVLQPGPDRRRC